MNIENLKSNWKKTALNPKSQEELSQMMTVNKHPVVKRTRIRFAIETCWLILFLVVFYGAFDGATKPLWASILLAISTLAYIINRVIGWYILKDPIKGENITTSLLKFQKGLKRIAGSTLITAFVFGLSIIVFFSTAIDFTASKYLLLFGMVITLVIFIYFSYTIWQKRIQIIEHAVNDFKV